MAASDNTRATDLIRNEHRNVETLFQQLEKTTEPEEKEAIFGTIAVEMSVHSEITDKVFYPAAKKAIGNEAIVVKAHEEQQHLKTLIDQLRRLLADLDKDEFDSKANALRAAAEAHWRAEEEELLPAVEKSDLDLVQLGQQMMQLQQDLSGAGLGSQGPM